MICIPQLLRILPDLEHWSLYVVFSAYTINHGESFKGLILAVDSIKGK